MTCRAKEDVPAGLSIRGKVCCEGPTSLLRDFLTLTINAALARLVLNYKGIPYQTVWLEYPELESTFKSYGIPPNAEGHEYTSPTVRIGDKYVMDSVKIVAELEKEHPSPSLYLNSPTLLKIQQILPKCIAALRATFMPKIPDALLNPASAGFWISKREKAFGKTLAQLAKEDGGDDAWENATPMFKEIGDILRANGGPFVLGKTGGLFNL